MTENNHNKAYYPLFFSIVFVLGMYLGGMLMGIKFSSYQGLKNSLFTINFNNYDKINDVLNYISDSYIDTINREQLIDHAINGLLHKLDPHSTYITANEFKQMNESLIGNFEGIGVEFRIDNDTVIVLNTISGGPSEKIGLRGGDRIILVDDTLIAGVGIKNAEVMKKLKGPKNTKVKVSILRKNADDLIDFVIKRGVIPTYSVDISYMVDEDIGYVKINRFSATTFNEFIEAVNKLKIKGMDKLIIDLRGNGGGYLNAAIQMADEFLDNKKLIVYTEGLNRPRAYAHATKVGQLKTTSFAILTDEWSASASEVFSGAMQDNDRGVIIGRRTFGKGLVQEQIELMDGSALRLTVAHYYTPVGRSIQSPFKNDIDNYYLNFYKRFFEDDKASDSLNLDTITFTTPNGKIVYGGGGIAPDILIEYNEDKYSIYYSKLANRGVIYEYAFQFADTKRDSLKNIFEKPELFIKNFNITNLIFNDFKNYAQNKGVVKEKSDKINSEIYIKTQLKAHIGRNLFSNEGFYPIMHQIDDTFLEALRVLKDSNLYFSYNADNKQ